MMTQTLEDPITEKAAYLQAVAERLCTVLREETSHLHAQQIEEFAALQEGKQKLFTAYEQTLREFEQQPSLLESLSELMRQEMRQALSQLQVVMIENRRTLKAARDSRRYVLKVMREAAISHGQELSSYGRKGQTQYGVFRAPSMAAAPVALNQQL